jgi:EAL domain-containing protein (putative c-di-GMP-specific phosphodiesterase class I)
MIFWQIVVVGSCMLSSAFLVFSTGGLTYVFSHTMYIAILLAGLLFDVWGGLLVALIGGLLLGPYMPLDTIKGIMQTPSNWIYRCCIFILVGFLQGSISTFIKREFARKRWTDTHNIDTGMENQVALKSALETLPATHSPQKTCCLGIFQVSNYDSIRSTFGKEVADKCISSVSEVLSRQFGSPGIRSFQILRETLCFFYIGGFPLSDEIAQKSLQFASLPIVIDNIPYYLENHLGTATQLIGDLDPEELINQAQIASMMACQENQFFMHFQSDFEQTTKRNLAIIGGVPLALSEHQFSLAFQPIVNTANQSVVGVEALLRWNSPSLGSLSPAIFIPLVENTPLIEVVQNWVLEEAFLNLKRLHQEFPDLYCSINLSANTLQNPKLVPFIQYLLDEQGIQANKIVFEVTETTLMYSPERALKTLWTLKDLGFRLSIDDFGTGLSSLAYLENIPADVLKIDKSFIDRIPTSSHTRLLIKGIISLAKDLGLSVVAEGVDEQEKVEYLSGIDCDYLQGFYYAKPLFFEQLVSWMKENQKAIC